MIGLPVAAGIIKALDLQYFSPLNCLAALPRSREQHRREICDVDDAAPLSDSQFLVSICEPWLAGTLQNINIICRQNVADFHVSQRIILPVLEKNEISFLPRHALWEFP